MIQQLVFTSAQEGLRPGSGGFTTVAATPGMSPPLIAQIEALSAYKFAFPPAGAQADKNPVSYAHRIVQSNKQSWQVLSRVAPAGADYTGRSNFIAHHALLDRNDRVPAGPAWTLKNSGLFLKEWAGQPRHLSDDHQFVRAEAQPTVCSAWQAATGDAGWGGVLVDSLYRARSTPAYVVYPAGLDMLALIDESLRLLPAEHRWAVTFDTYFTDDHPDVKCLWRCVLAHSPPADRVKKGSPSLVIDLTQPLDSLADSRGVRAARAGAACPPPASAGKKPSPAAVASSPPAIPAAAKGPRSPQAAPLRGDYDVATNAPPTPSIKPLASQDPPAQQEADKPKRSSASSVLFVVGLSLLLALIVGGMVLAVTKPWEKLHLVESLKPGSAIDKDRGKNSGDQDEGGGFVTAEGAIEPATLEPINEESAEESGVVHAGDSAADVDAAERHDSDQASATVATATTPASKPIHTPLVINGKRAYHLPAGDNVRVEIRRDALMLGKSSVQMPLGDRRSVDIREVTGSLVIRDQTNIRPETVARITIDDVGTHTTFRVVDGSLPAGAALIIPSSGEGEFVFYASPAREAEIIVDSATGANIKADLLAANTVAGVASANTFWEKVGSTRGPVFIGDNFLLRPASEPNSYSLHATEGVTGSISQALHIYNANAVPLLRITAIAKVTEASQAAVDGGANASDEDALDSDSEADEAGSQAGGPDDAES